MTDTATFPSDAAIVVAPKQKYSPGSKFKDHDIKITAKNFMTYDVVSIVALVLAVVFMFAPAKETYEEMTDHEAGEVHMIVVNAILIILTGLVVVNLSFEATQHYLEHNIHAQFLPVLNALNTELMGMGFLAIWVYFTLKSEVLLRVGEKTVCLTNDKYMINGVPDPVYHCDEKIIHMFEDIHMSLFLVLVLFFMRVCLLMFQIDLIAVDWEEMEHAMMHKGVKTITGDYSAALANPLSSFRERKDKQERYEFMLLKQRFLDQMKTTIKNPEDFSFADYLTIEGALIAQEVVEIPPSEWIALEVFFFFLWLGLRQPTYLRIRCFLAFAILSLILCFQLIGKMEWVLQQLVPEKKIGAGQNASKFERYNPKKKKAQQVVPDGPADENFEIPGDPIFMHTLKESTSHHNPAHQQEGLFYGGGEHLTLHILRFFMLTTMIFFVLLITMIPFAEGLGTVNTVLVVLPAPFLLALLVVVPHELLKDLTISSKVEFLKKPKTVEKVCRNIRIAKNLRALSILRALQSNAACSKDVTLASIDMETMDEPTRLRFVDLKRTFELFDLDESGSVDTSELSSLMLALGIDLNDKEKANVMREFDRDLNGNICWQEFWTYMIRRNDVIDAQQVVHEVFDAIDADGSGSLTVEEFSKVLRDLGSDLSDRDIEDMCREIDSSGDGSISLDEFAVALEGASGGQKKQGVTH
jgi:calmodulin